MQVGWPSLWYMDEFLLLAFPVLVLHTTLVAFDSLNSLDTFLGSQEVSRRRRIRE